jgi:hypothetical protein
MHEDVVMTLIDRWRTTGFQLIKVLRMTNPVLSVEINREFEERLAEMTNMQIYLTNRVNQLMLDEGLDRRTRPERRKS